MSSDLLILLATAASLGFIHTLAGPDHYIPFIVIGRARNWSKMKTLWITFISGLGHVGSSVVIGAIGIAFGIGVDKIENMESTRGDIVGWAFIIFGLAYLGYGIWRAVRFKPHTHIHFHQEAKAHVHKHDHLHAEEKYTMGAVYYLCFGAL